MILWSFFIDSLATSQFDYYWLSWHYWYWGEVPCLLFHDQDTSTNDIVELFPAPVDPTQMTQARGKERSLKIASFTIITVKIWFLISSVSFYTCDLAQNPNTKRKPIIKSEQRDDLKFMLTKSHVFGSEIPEWRKMSNKPVSLAAAHWEEGRPLRNLPARHFCRELLLAARHILDFFTCFVFFFFNFSPHFWPSCE